MYVLRYVGSQQRLYGKVLALVASCAVGGDEIIGHKKPVQDVLRRVLAVIEQAFEARIANPAIGRETNMARNSKAFYIEPNGKGQYAYTRSGASRASGTKTTQKDAIDAARAADPNAALHVARVRHVQGGDPDKFRTIKGE